MLSTSAEFQTKIDSKARRFYPIVRINYTDVFLDPTITATSTDEARISWTQQAVNGRVDMTHKWASLDGTSLLDGSYYLVPDTEALANFNESGWWSNTLSDGSGNFSPSVDMQITFTSRKVSSYYIAADDKRNEYPVDFTVELYDGVSLIFSDVVTGNTLIKYQALFAQQDNIDKAVLKITKWSHSGRNIKIAEFTTQVLEEYTGESICDFNIIEQREISNDNSIPVGNIAISESSLCLINNQNRQFDANNTTSRLYGLIKPNVKVDILLGMITSGTLETIPLHSGWALGWNVPENDIRATLTIRGRLQILSQTKFNDSVVVQNENFYQWFERVLNNGGLANTEYNIDTTLQGANYVVPFGWFENISHKNALELLAQASSSVVYQDRAGLIQVKTLSNFPTSVVKTYTRDDYMDKDNQPIYQNIANAINVTTSPIEKTTGQTVYTTLSTDPEDIAASTTDSYTIFYSDKPVSDQVASISPPVAGVSITVQTHYSWGSVIDVQNTNPSPQQFFFSVTGSTYAVVGQKTVSKEDQNSIDDNGRQEFNYPENLFLQNKSLADDIATSLLASFKDPERDLSISFNPGGNPSIELGDRIAVTDLYTTTNYNVVSTEMTFNGGLLLAHKGRI